MITLETERLQTRNFAAADWQALREVMIHYQASASAHYEPSWPTTPAEL